MSITKIGPKFSNVARRARNLKNSVESYKFGSKFCGITAASSVLFSGAAYVMENKVVFGLFSVVAGVFGYKGVQFAYRAFKDSRALGKVKNSKLFKSAYEHYLRTVKKVRV